MAHITSLPNELLALILARLDGPALATCAHLSRRFRTLAATDTLWSSLVSSLRLTSPAPYSTFRALYAALHRHLWLHGQIWHGDRRFTGYLLIARYNASSGAVEIYNLLANQHGTSTSLGRPWSQDPHVLIAAFDPQVRFWEEPILTLVQDTPRNEQDEIQPPSRRGRGAIACSLSRSSVIPPQQQEASMSLWPPPTIPSAERTRNTSFRGGGGANASAVTRHPATTLFRLRKWMTFASATPHSPFERPPRHIMASEDVETFSALDSSLYTPDALHPMRGLWVGDYNAHGCEFVLFHQPTPERLEGIKITGDINVPRGEYTFIVEDLNNPVRIADEEEWPGAKVVRGRWQIAASQFVDKKFIDTELIIISDSEVGFHWRPSALYGHISRFKRLDVDRFIYGSDAITFPTAIDAAGVV